MQVRMKSANEPVRRDRVALLEATTGCRTPRSYLEFLERHDGGMPEANEFSIATADDVATDSVPADDVATDNPSAGNASGVNEFLSIESVLAQKHLLGRRLPPEAFPVAEAEGGNLVCLVFGGPNHGHVFFWDHELEVDGEGSPSHPNLIELASDFGGFLQSLSRFDPRSVRLDPERVKRVWVDPDFLRSIRDRGE